MENIYLAECNTSDDCIGYDEMIIAIKLAYDDGECISQCDLYDFMHDVLQMDWEDIYDTLIEQDRYIHKYEKTYDFFQNLRF